MLHVLNIKPSIWKANHIFNVFSFVPIQWCEQWLVINQIKPTCPDCQLNYPWNNKRNNKGKERNLRDQTRQTFNFLIKLFFDFLKDYNASKISRNFDLKTPFSWRSSCAGTMNGSLMLLAVSLSTLTPRY